MQLGEYGSVITVETGVDLTGINDYWLVLLPPDQVAVEKDKLKLTVVSPATAGKISYTVEAGVLSQEGTWTAQVFLKWTAPAQGLVSPPATFEVGESIVTPFWSR